MKSTKLCSKAAMRRIVTFLVLSIVCTPPAQAGQLGAHTASSPHLYTLERKKDLGLIIAGGVLAAGAMFSHPSHQCSCDPATVNRLDRPFAGDSSRKGPDTASNVLVVTMWTAPFVVDYLDTRRNKQRGFREDAVVMGESFLLNFAATEVTKKIVSRPRPFIYGPHSDQESMADDSFQSFYSGHTSSAFAVGIAYARTYARRHPGGKRALVYGIAAGVAATTGALRVGARKHFPTDVLMGAGSGIAVGLIVPAMH